MVSLLVEESLIKSTTFAEVAPTDRANKADTINEIYTDFAISICNRTISQQPYFFSASSILNRSLILS